MRRTLRPINHARWHPPTSRMKLSKLRATLFVISAVAPFSASAAWQTDGLKVSNPRELGYWLNVDSNCPVSENSVKRTIEGVFIRSRLKPLENHISKNEKFSLTVRVACLETKRRNGERLGKYSYNVAMRFGQLIDGNDWIQNYNYGGLAYGDALFLTEVVRGHAERAATAYIRSNLSSYALADQ